MERCHRTLKSKIEYDLSKLGQDGVNWAKQLPTYQRILNNDPKEVIAHKTPFEIYFARKCHNLRKGGLDEECFLSPEKIRPTKKIDNDIPDKLLNSESKHRKRQGDVTSVHSERIFA